jgi:hypothetical protein
MTNFGILKLETFNLITNQAKYSNEQYNEYKAQR